jgi:purine-cytosine permease-like protein
MPVSWFMEPDQTAARARAMGIGLGILLIAVGSVLLFALTASSLHIVGIILMAAGVLVLLSALARAMLSSGRLRTSWVSPGTKQGYEDTDSDNAPGNEQDDL